MILLSTTADVVYNPAKFAEVTRQAQRRFALHVASGLQHLIAGSLLEC